MRPMTREERKKAYMKQAEGMFEELERWYDKNAAASFEEIEKRARQARRKLMGTTMEIMINGRDVGKTESVPKCGECGGGMEFKGYRKKTIVGLEGDTQLERAYYVCQETVCEKQTAFPPRQKPKTTRRPLECRGGKGCSQARIADKLISISGSRV